MRYAFVAATLFAGALAAQQAPAPPSTLIWGHQRGEMGALELMNDLGYGPAPVPAEHPTSPEQPQPEQPKVSYHEMEAW